MPIALFVAAHKSQGPTVHTATNDVLNGYREMSARAEPDIQAVIRRLTDVHELHAAEQAAELLRFRAAGKDDSSVQGTMNKVVVILRDWLSGLDRDTLRHALRRVTQGAAWHSPTQAPGRSARR